MKALYLSDMAKGINARASGNTLISGVSIDSRKVKKGEMYIAIAGERFDGHDFINSAVENGAAAVMSHKDIECSVPVISVENTEQGFLKLASWYRELINPFVVALTGSVGKTTTKEMLSAVFSSERNTLKTEGNLNNQIGVPKTLMRLDDSIETAIIEMGMDGKGQISLLSRCALPDAALITNIGVSHLENLGSREGILAAKLEILEGLKPDGKVFLNGDDPLLMSAHIDDHQVIYYGINNSMCRYKAVDIKSDNLSTEFDIVWDDKKQHITLPTIGIHNVYNAAAAFAAGVEHGISPENAAKGLASYAPSGMRQRICQKGGVTFIEDCYNASPDSVRAALNTLESISAKRKIAVLGDMLELGSVSEEAHRKSGILAAKKGIDAVFTFGERSLLTAQKAAEMGVGKVESFTEHKALADALNGYIRPGDAVIFKASRGMKLENVIDEVYKKFE
ncbi:MAG: UDP-N-acetylmuramoyl-tripeptide--D-alanyl-D-alanine ligase [Clostridia bacterium]|nr:UDP-N-acetylmuramoyl-tripeptide--D-alanyl-D-alanine ligase [Clostridia bacterium]